MKFTNLVNSFKTGKISRKLANRQDVEALKSSCEKIDNFYVTPMGTLKRRTGTEIVSAPTVTLPTNGKIFEFNYNESNAFVVSIKNGADLFNWSTRTDLYNQGSWFGASTPSLDDIKIFDLLGREYKVSGLKNLGSASPLFSTAYALFGSTGPFSGYETRNFQAVQFGRKLVFVDTTGVKAPFVIDLILSNATVEFVVYPFLYDWSIHTFKADDEVNGGGYVALGGTTHNFPQTSQLKTPITISNPSGFGTVGKIQLSYTPALKTITIPKIYVKGDMLGVGLLVSNSAITTEGIFTIVGPTGTSTATTIDYYAISSVEGIASSGNFDLVSFSRWGDVRGFPQAISSFRDRLVFGATPTSSNRFWLGAVNANNLASFQNMMTRKLVQDASSNTSDLFFFGTATNDVAITGAFNDSETGAIKWIRGKRLLHFGTSSGEQQMSFINGVVQLSNIDVVRVSSYSSSSVQPVEGDKKIFYVANTNDTIRALSTDNRDSESNDVSLSILNDNYPFITKVRWCEESSSLLFLHADVGGSKLSGLTVAEQAQTSAFFDFLFNNDLFTIDDMCVVKGVTGMLNRYSQAIKECIVFRCSMVSDNSVFLLKTYLPIVDLDRANFNNIAGMFHMDLMQTSSALEGANTKTNILWANQFVTVVCVSNTFDILSTTVVEATALGAVVFDAPENSFGCVIGIQSPDAEVITSPINFGSQVGQAVGLIKRIDRIMPSFTKSGKAYVGTTNASIYITEKVDGWFNDYDKVFEASNNPDYEIKCRIKSFGIEPLNISNIAFRGVTYEGE